MRQLLVCILLVLSTNISFCQNPFIFTVKGRIKAEKLGFTLPHEHVMSNFGVDIEIADQYDVEAVLKQVVPYLNRLNTFGVQSIFDGTAAYFGRDPVLLESISTQTGIHIITNTGFYGAADDRYVPKFAFKASLDSIADLWIDEFKNGIDGTEIRPGFIKLAFDSGRPSKIDLKLFEAGVLTHLKTGLTLAVHTGNNLKAVRKQILLLKKHGISPTALIWIHANKVENDRQLLKMALSGVWISLDGVDANNIEEYVDRLALFKKNDLLHKVLLSHDGNSFPRGAAIRPYQAISELVIPKLRELGYSEAEIHQLTVENPKNAYMVQVRNL